MRALGVAAVLALAGLAALVPRAKARFDTWRLYRDPDALCRVAEVQLQLGNEEEARELAEAALRRVPGHATAMALREDAIVRFLTRRVVIIPISCGGGIPTEGSAPDRAREGR
jgi:hypothetical protein